MSIIIRFFNQVKDFLIISTCCGGNTENNIKIESSPLLARKIL